jgi:hypothetical protein
VADTANLCGMTILRTTGSARATKRWSWNPTLREWRKVSYSAGAWFTPQEHRVSNLAELVSVLDHARRDPCAFLVRGALTSTVAATIAADPTTRIRRRKHARQGVDPSLVEADRRWIMVDIDGWPLPAWADLADDPETVIEHAVHELLPESFHDTTCWWQLSSSAGFSTGLLKVHLFYWLTEPASNEHIKAVLKQCAPGVDRAPFSAAQPHFIADPIIEGGHDPLPRRTGWRQGLEVEVILPPLLAIPPSQSRPGHSGGGGDVADALGVLGDGDGLDGFHAPLRTATMRYALRCNRYGARDDEAMKGQLRAAIRSAQRRSDRDIEATYTTENYLQPLIDGAFALLSAEPDLQKIQPHHAAPHQTVQQARDAIGEHVGAFLGRVVDWHQAGKERPPAEHAALVVGVGVGKSKAAREAMTGFIEAAREADRTFEEKVMEGSMPHRVLWLVPTHKLGNEALAAMQDLGLSVAVMRGREAKVPGTEDPENGIEALPMCLNLPAVEDAVAIGHDVEKSVCGTGKEAAPVCPFRGECAYQKQKRAVAEADVVIAPHQALFHHIPKQATDGVGLVVADESWWQAGLQPNREIRLAGFADEPLLYPVLEKGNVRVGARGGILSWRMVTAEEATNDLHHLSAKAQAAFEATPHGELVSKAAVTAAGLTAADCAEARKLEWQRKVENAIHPGMSPDARKKGMERAAGNAAIPRRVGLWGALEELLNGDEAHTGRLEMGIKAGADGADRVVLLHTRREVLEAIVGLPILALDATMPADVVKHYLPRLTVLANVQPHAPNMTVHQILGGWGKTSLVQSNRATLEENQRRSGVVAELADFVRLNSGGNALVVTYQDLEDRFALQGVRTGHFNAISGLDTFGDVRSLFVIGRPLPAPTELLTMARALTGLPIALENGRLETRGVLMTDGTGSPINVRVYADETLEALRVAITDAEVIQAIGRGRGVNRQASTFLFVIVLADVVLPLPVVRIVRWVDIRPNVIARMLARNGVLWGASDACLAYPDLFPTPDAARMAVKRLAGISRTSPYVEYIIGECSGNRPIQVSYRPMGRGQQLRTATVTANQIEAFRPWLEMVVGPLAQFDVAPTPTRDEQPPATIASMTDAEKLALRERLQANATQKDRPMNAAAINEQTDQDGIDPSMVYAPAHVGLGFVGGVAGRWTVKQPAGREPIRVIDRPLSILVRSRMNRLHWLQPAGEPEPVAVAFLAPVGQGVHADA